MFVVRLDMRGIGNFRAHLFQALCIDHNYWFQESNKEPDNWAIFGPDGGGYIAEGRNFRAMAGPISVLVHEKEAYDLIVAVAEKYAELNKYVRITIILQDNDQEVWEKQFLEAHDKSQPNKK